MTATPAQIAAVKSEIAAALATVAGMSSGNTVTALKKSLTTAQTQAGQIQVVTPPPPPPPTMTFTAKATTVSECTVSWTGVSPVQLGRNGTDAGGTGPWNTGPLTGQPTSGSFAFEFLVPGTTYTYTLTEASGALLTVVLLQPAVTPPPPPPPPQTGMAIGVSLGYDPALWSAADHGAAQYAIMKSDGFYGVRIDCPMSGPGANDATIRAAVAAGLDVLLILDGYQTQNGPTAFAAFASTTAKEYAPLGVHHYELLNEPGSATNWDTTDNFVNPAAYATLCKQAYTAIKAADSASTVVLGGNSVFQSSNGAGPDANGNYVGSLLPATFLTAIYAANGGTTAGLCDAIGMHPYCDPNLPSTSNNWGAFLNPVGTEGFYGDSVFAVMSAHGDAKKPVWITEFGFQNASVQAQGFTNALTLATEGPAVVTAFYCFNWEDDTDGDWGLNTSAYVAKPALAAVEKFLTGVTPPPPPPPPPPATWQAGNFGSRLGMYNGAANGASLGAAAQVGILNGFTPPLYSSYPWGCGALGINQTPSQNGITAIAQDASSHGLKCMIGFPMSGGVDGCTVPYTTVLSGGRDADAKYFAQTLVANGCPDAMVRLGWEMNQSSSNGTPAQYAQSAARMSSVMKTVAPKLQMVWNPTMASGEAAAAIEAFYPGDGAIDGVCLDFYDTYFYTTAGGPGAAGSAYPGIAVTWPYYLAFPASGGGAGAGLTWLANFGTAHGKWIGFCECGLGWNDQYRVSGGDNPAFETDLAQWTMQHSSLVKIITLWNSGGSGFSGTSGSNPQSLNALAAALSSTPT